jgi:hypothetical protein
VEPTVADERKVLVMVSGVLAATTVIESEAVALEPVESVT